VTPVRVVQQGFQPAPAHQRPRQRRHAVAGGERSVLRVRGARGHWEPPCLPEG
jgi:hypothetical protein